MLLNFQLLHRFCLNSRRKKPNRTWLRGSRTSTSGAVLPQTPAHRGLVYWHLSTAGRESELEKRIEYQKGFLAFRNMNHKPSYRTFWAHVFSTSKVPLSSFVNYFNACYFPTGLKYSRSALVIASSTFSPSPFPLQYFIWSNLRRSSIPQTNTCVPCRHKSASKSCSFLRWLLATKLFENWKTTNLSVKFELKL